MLIVEGSDLVGKSTFVKLLLEEAEKRDYPMVPQHFGLIPRGWDYYRDYLPYVNKRTVMDRFIMSEFVYGKVVRGKCGIDPATYDLLDAHLRLDGSFTVVMYVDPGWYEDHLVDTYRLRHQEFEVDALVKVNRAFAYLVNSVEGGLWGYRPDFDFVVNVIDNDHWPNEVVAGTVVGLYLERLKKCRGTLKSC